MQGDERDDGGRLHVDRFQLHVDRFHKENRADFDALHSEACGAGWCQCVAWWTKDWESWGDRTADENRALRDALCERGEYDGYLAWRGAAAVGWCQVGPRDRLVKLARQFELAPAPETWAVSCFLVAPAERGRGVARQLLRAVLEELPTRGARRVEAYPKRAQGSDRGSNRAQADGELWNGPESLFLGQGFRVLRDDPTRPVLALDF